MRDGEGNAQSENCLKVDVLAMNRCVTVSYWVRREALLLKVLIKKEAFCLDKDIFRQKRQNLFLIHS